MHSISFQESLKLANWAQASSYHGKYKTTANLLWHFAHGYAWQRTFQWTAIWLLTCREIADVQSSIWANLQGLIKWNSFCNTEKSAQIHFVKHGMAWHLCFFETNRLWQGQTLKGSLILGWGKGCNYMGESRQILTLKHHLVFEQFCMLVILYIRYICQVPHFALNMLSLGFPPPHISPYILVICCKTTHEHSPIEGFLQLQKESSKQAFI